MKNKAAAMRNILLAMVGLGLCMIGCWLSGSYGEGNVRNGLIQSNWVKMSYIRLEDSIIMSALGIGISYPGFRDFIKAVKLSRRKNSINDFRMVRVFEIGMASSLISYLFIFTGYTMIAIVYRQLFVTNLMGADIISVTEGMFYYIAVPLLTLLVLSVGCTSVAYMYLVYCDRIRVSSICMFFNPLVFMLIGELLKLTKLYYLSDFASGLIPMGYVVMFAAGMSHVAKMKPRRRA